MPTNPEPAPTTVSCAEAYRIYRDQGLSLRELGKRLGVHGSVMGRRFKDAGYKLRPRGKHPTALVRSGTSELTVRNSGGKRTTTLVRFKCHSPSPHYEMRGPSGELVEYLGLRGSYRYTDKITGEVIETESLPSHPVPKVPEGDRKACYEDPAWEARKNIVDRVACRECFDLFGSTMWSHLLHGGRHHQMSTKEYAQAHPGFRLRSFREMARIARKPASYAYEVAHKFAESYATPEERAAAAGDPEYEDHKGIRDYVICREDRCGLKAASLNSHIPRTHGKTVKTYRRDHDWPAVTCADALESRRNDRRARRNGNEELQTVGSKAFWARRKAEEGRLREAEQAAINARKKAEELEKYAAELRAKVETFRRHRDQATDRRIELAGTLAAQGKSQRSMSLQLYPEQKHTPEAAYGNTRRLFSDYRQEIDAAKERYLAAHSQV